MLCSSSSLTLPPWSGIPVVYHHFNNVHSDCSKQFMLNASTNNKGQCRSVGPFWLGRLFLIYAKLLGWNSAGIPAGGVRGRLLGATPPTAVGIADCEHPDLELPECALLQLLLKGIATSFVLVVYAACSPKNTSESLTRFRPRFLSVASASKHCKSHHIVAPSKKYKLVAACKTKNPIKNLMGAGAS